MFFTYLYIKNLFLPKPFFPIIQVGKFIRRDHANAHGIRKGSALFATSGTTCPPSVASIANRGDWSMGAVLDVYWHFSEPGDHFLGRVLTGLDPNKSEFASPPPHFVMEGNLLEDEDINAAMQMMYGPILEKYKDNAEINPTGLLLMVLASVIYHSSWISEIIIKKPGHPFSLMPLMNCPELLERLKEKVSLKVGGKSCHRDTSTYSKCDTLYKITEIVQ